MHIHCHPSPGYRNFVCPSVQIFYPSDACRPVNSSGKQTKLELTMSVLSAHMRDVHFAHQCPHLTHIDCAPSIHHPQTPLLSLRLTGWCTLWPAQPWMSRSPGLILTRPGGSPSPQKRRRTRPMNFGGHSRWAHASTEGIVWCWTLLHLIRQQ